MKIAILIFDDLTTLDAIGPFEVLCRIPGAEVMFVGETAGIKRADPKSLGIIADYSIADVTSADILLVPGGRGEAQVREKPHMLEWVRKIDATTQWTTSVCTGSLVLGAAGLLKGRPATTHWARLEKLREFGAEPRSQRIVEDGKIITAAGVSAGIDMALHLVAPRRGRHYRARDPGGHRIRSAAAVRRKCGPRASDRSWTSCVRGIRDHLRRIEHSNSNWRLDYR